MTSLTLASYAIHDEGNKNSKNESKLKKRHQWEGVELSSVRQEMCASEAKRMNR